MLAGLEPILQALATQMQAAPLPTPFDAEAARLRALVEYDILDTEAEPAFDELVQLTARCLNAPIAAISLIASDRQWSKASIGLPARQLPRDIAFCNESVRTCSALVVPDTLEDVRFANNPLVVGAPGIRAYAGVPLLTPEGHALGTLCVMSMTPREFTTEHLSMLQALGHQVGAHLQLRRQSEPERALRGEQQLNRQIVEHSPIGICIFDRDGCCVTTNPAMARMIGATLEQIRAQNFHSIQSWKESGMYTLAKRTLESGERSRGVVRVVSTFGKRLTLALDFSILAGSRAGHLMVMAQDLTEVDLAEEARKEVEARLGESLNLLSSLAQRVPGMMFQYQRFPDGRSAFPFASEGIEEIYEVTPAEVRDNASLIASRIHPDDEKAVYDSICVSEQALSPWSLEYRVVLPRQGVRWRLGDADPERLPDGSVLWHGFICDITERKKNEDHANQLAYYDSLTGLPNRRLLLDRIEQSLGALRRSREIGALMYLDLDEFKRINDARGHAVGDALLKEVALRLKNVLRNEDTVARIGGDEFVVLISDLAIEQTAAEWAALLIAEKIREALDQPYIIAGKSYNSSATIGITLFPRGSETVDDLLREADTAMYRAKEAGRNRVAFYESAMQTEVEDRLALEHDLKLAIARNQLTLDVQGQFDSSGTLAGAELLARWTHDTRGAVSPDEFIPVAERSGMIVRLGEWVLEQACHTLVRLAAAGVHLPLSINVSPRQFRSENFVGRVASILASTGAPGDQLIFEVTEGLLLGDRGQDVSRMSRLAEMGIRFSIDDFGTGYSNLAYLKDLPLFQLKIDKRFVHGAQAESAETAIVKVILSLAALFNLRVVAEGVETHQQADFLIRVGCGFLQGFLLARPKPLEEWVRDREASQITGSRRHS